MTDSRGNDSRVVGSTPGGGAHAPGVPRPRTAPPVRPPNRPQFELTLRGYDRTAVDAFLDAHLAEQQELGRQLEASERRRLQADQYAASTERENRTLRENRATTPAPAAGEGFGLRVEKLLRLAEQEAAEVRDGASREASALLKQAQARAEQHRHEVEQDLISRSAVLDQQMAQRAVEQQEREQVAEQVLAARAEAQSVLDAAERDAEQTRSQAEAAAVTVRAGAHAEARRVVDQARQEADRLNAVRGGARADIARLVDLLAVELGRPRPKAVPTAASPRAGGPPGADASATRVQAATVGPATAGRAAAAAGR